MAVRDVILILFIVVVVDNVRALCRRVHLLWMLSSLGLPSFRVPFVVPLDGIGARCCCFGLLVVC